MLTAILIAAGFMNIGALYFLRRKVLKMLTPDNRPLDSNEFFTVGVWSTEDKFTDTKKPYSVMFVLKMNDDGERKIEGKAIPVEQTNHLVNGYKNGRTYTLFLEPWVEGTLTLGYLKDNLGGFQLVVR